MSATTKRAAATTRASGAVLALLALVLGCRGAETGSPPIHLNPNMDQQARIDPQEPDPFFRDGRGMRLPPPGTVPRGATFEERADILREDDHLYAGKVGGAFATALPLPLTPALLRVGQQRFTIYCTPCHDAAGTGDGVIVRRGMVQPPPFDDPRLLAMPVGQIYDVISHGVRNMPPYAAQIPVRDRWAISAYVRALQIARTASLEQIPSAERGRLDGGTK